MPPTGKEVQLTELEVDIMSAFVKRKMLSDEECGEVLLHLYAKLMGSYASKNRDIPN